MRCRSESETWAVVARANIRKFTVESAVLSAILLVAGESRGTDDRPENGGRPVAEATDQPVSAAKAEGELILSAWRIQNADELPNSVAEISKPSFDARKWIPATVPGTVLTSLVDRHVLPDPRFGVNNLSISEDFSKHPYWHRNQFTVPPSYRGRQIWLLFEGINYRAEVWLNGKPLGAIRGAFIRGNFDVTSAVKFDEENILAVKIYPPPTPGARHERSLAKGTGPNGGLLTRDGPTFFATVGWDWIPTLPGRSMGIWQQVSLRATGPVVFADPQIVAKLPASDYTTADLFVAVELRNVSAAAQKGTLNVNLEGIEVNHAETLSPGETKTVTLDPSKYPQLRVKNPRLWWPNGYGKQELYTAELSFTGSAGRVSDRRSVPFGIRKISYELQPELVILVNGQKIMCKGGNWGMDDAMKYIPKKRLDAFIRMHRDANLTMIRNWTGQSTEEDFYRLCDEYGILVWNDFWLANPADGPDPKDAALFLANAEDTVKRFRNHPCIALWCGRNEGMPPPAIQEGLKKLLKKLDGTRRYQSTSDAEGVHGHGPYEYQDPVSYFKKHAHGFTTEIGLPAVPSLESLRGMMAEKDLWPINETWAYHDFCPGAQNYKGYVRALESRYGAARNAQDFCRKAQMINFETYRALFEAWNRKLWQDASGALLWMSHPAWPSTVWQLYDYDLEPTAALFGVKHACEPIHVQMNLDDATVSIINNTSRPLRGVKATARVYNLDAALLGTQENTLDAAANSSVPCFAIRWPGNLSPAHFVKLQLHGRDGRLLSENFYWRGVKNEDLVRLGGLPKAELAGEATSASSAGKVLVTVGLKNPSVGAALMIKVTLCNSRTNARVLPAFASDNYFSLMPGETKRLTLECSQSELDGQPPKVSLDGWNVSPTTLFVKISKDGN
jgi:hypothetical protein